MSTANKPHRRLSLTQPTEARDAQAAEPLVADDLLEQMRIRLAECEQRLAEAEARLAVPRTEADSHTLIAPVVIRDRHGRLLLEIDAQDDGACLKLFDAQGSAVAALTAQNDGGGLGIRNQQGEVVGTLFAHAEGGGLTLRTEEGKAAVSAFAHHGGGALNLFDRRGKLAAVLGAGRNGGRLDLNDHAGTQAVKVGVRDTGGGVTVYDRDGKPGAVLGLTDDGGGLGLYRKVRYPDEESGANGHSQALEQLEADREAYQARRDLRGLSALDRGSRRAVGVFADAGGVIKVYDQDGREVHAYRGTDAAGLLVPTREPRETARQSA